jgi:hypothetical protein
MFVASLMLAQAAKWGWTNQHALSTTPTPKSVAQKPASSSGGFNECVVNLHKSSALREMACISSKSSRRV